MEVLGGYVTIYSGDNIIKYMSFGFCIAWAIFYACVYVYFMFNDPDRLQSESYNLETKTLVLGSQRNTDILSTANVVNADDLKSSMTSAIESTHIATNGSK